MKRVLCLCLVLCMVLLCLCGCGHPHYAIESAKPLDAGDDAVHESIRRFQEAECIGYGRGEYFEAKALACFKVHWAEYTYYYYRIVVAPITDHPLCCVNYHFYPTAGLMEYFHNEEYRGTEFYLNKWGNKYPPTSNSYMGLKHDWTTDYDMPDLGTKWAIEHIFFWNNVTDGCQEEFGISKEDYHYGMTHLMVEAEFNGKTESFPLFIHEAPFIEDADDERIQNELYLVRFLKSNNGARGGGSHVYEGESEE